MLTLLRVPFRPVVAALGSHAPPLSRGRRYHSCSAGCIFARAVRSCSLFNLHPQEMTIAARCHPFRAARCRASLSCMFTSYLNRWGLTPDGEPIITHSSRLLPVRQNATPAILKIALTEEERSGAALMSWWNGDGAARVLAKDGNAILLERAEGKTSLAELAQKGQDDEASRIICSVVAKLHAAARAPPPAGLVPLSAWFRALEPAAARFGGVLLKSAEAADHLLATPRDVVVLHGDIQHGNILDFGVRGWLAIDPKGLCVPKTLSGLVERRIG
jgi:streptomycin 6-kinase